MAFSSHIKNIKNTKWVLWFSLALIICLLSTAPTARANPAYQVETIAQGLETPWSLCVLPNGDILVTELEGRLRMIKQGRLLAKPIEGVPSVYYASQGGLMDVIIDPDYQRNQIIYLSYAHGKSGDNATAIMRAKLVNGRLLQKKVIFQARPRKTTPAHYGAKMAFLPDGTLLVAIGDGFDNREEAQNLANHFGTIIRITTKGKAPKDNPFIGRAKALPHIYSYGHRNMQALLVDKKGRIYANEHGPRGGDEVNIINAGKNYGWPVITYGKDYSGAVISPWTKKKGMEQPIWQWTPSIAPSAMILYEGDAFKQWRGDLLTTSLVFGYVVRLDLDASGTKVQASEIIFKDLDSRLRDIRADSKGALYIIAETKGEILKITPQ